MTDTPQPIIELSNLSFSYGAGEVLCCAHLVVNKGDYLGIIGPNGGGKTTLLKLIVGLLHPSQGSIRIFGKEQKLLTDRSRIGYVPQKTSSFDMQFPATVFDVVLMGRYAKRGLFRRINSEDRAAAELALRRVDMWDYRHQLIGSLSGGEEQRVFIARALATSPTILFLDEPTAGIDHRAQEEFYALLRKLNRDEGLTIILVSHDIGALAKEASRLLYVDTTLTYYSSPSLFLEKNAQHTLSHGHDH